MRLLVFAATLVVACQHAAPASDAALDPSDGRPSPPPQTPLAEPDAAATVTAPPAPQAPPAEPDAAPSPPAAPVVPPPPAEDAATQPWLDAESLAATAADVRTWLADPAEAPNVVLRADTYGPDGVTTCEVGAAGHVAAHDADRSFYGTMPAAEARRVITNYLRSDAYVHPRPNAAFDPDVCLELRNHDERVDSLCRVELPPQDHAAFDATFGAATAACAAVHAAPTATRRAGEPVAPLVEAGLVPAWRATAGFRVSGPPNARGFARWWNVQVFPDHVYALLEEPGVPFQSASWDIPREEFLAFVRAADALRTELAKVPPPPKVGESELRVFATLREEEDNWAVRYDPVTPLPAVLRAFAARQRAEQGKDPLAFVNGAPAP